MHARRQWWPLAAAATIGAVAFGLLQLAPPDHVGAPVADNAVVTDTPSPAATRPPETSEATSKVAALPAAKNESPASRPDARRATPPAVGAAPQPAPGAAPRDLAAAPQPFPASAPLEEIAAPAGASPAHAPSAGDRIAESAPPMTPPAAPPTATLGATAIRPAPATAAPDAPTTEIQSARTPPPARQAATAKVAAARADGGAATQELAKERAPLPVGEWIALMRRLRDEGRFDEAHKELAAFRAAHADHERLLPPDLRDWRPPAK